MTFALLDKPAVAPGAYSLHRSAVAQNRPINIGGEGEQLLLDSPKDVTNLQGWWALGKNYGRSQDTISGPAGRTLAGMIREGLKFLLYDAKSGKLPYRDNSVPRVYTNSVPVDTPPGGTFPGVQSAEIIRVLKPGGQWIDNGVVRYTKPGAGT